MALFDRYLMVDWSAANSPKTGADSLWVAALGRKDGRLGELVTINFATRRQAADWIAGEIAAAQHAGERMLAGFDFAFAYPAGAAERIAGKPSWEALWQRLAELIEDDDDNCSNRFEVAARLNDEAFGDGPLYWGLPAGRSMSGLSARKPAARQDGLAGRRIAEARAKGAQSPWQLYGAGSVGSQALTGIARLAHLRADPRLAGAIRVWPFETGFAPFDPAPCVFAEIYPSLFKASLPADPIKDRAQVQHLARIFADLDSHGRLAALMQRPDDLADDEVKAVLEEEGWILGIGHEKRTAPAPSTVADALDYIRDPAEIYRQSFRTIRAEADLSRFPPGLDDLAIRLIHACGMVDIVDDIAFSDEAFANGAAALAAGAPILCDVEMVRHGIIRALLPRNNDVACLLNEPGVADHAKSIGNTRSAAQVDFWGDRLEGAVVAIGNAPTALFRLLEQVAAGGPRPAVVLGLPVGFVGAAESKAALKDNGLGLDFITVLGRRGGSAMASAAVNALAGGLKTNV